MGTLGFLPEGGGPPREGDETRFGVCERLSTSSSSPLDSDTVSESTLVLVEGDEDPATIEGPRGEWDDF